MKKEKTNIEHLRDILNKMTIEDTTEAMEFLEAIEEELADEKGKPDGEKYEEILSERDELKEEVDELKGALEDYVNPDELVEIDCGIGTIRVEYPDNIKLQCIVDDFKNALEKKSKFGAGV